MSILGAIIWDFAVNSRSFEIHLRTYNRLAIAVDELRSVRDSEWSLRLINHMSSEFLHTRHSDQNIIADIFQDTRHDGG
jgi:hypothetical protein